MSIDMNTQLVDITLMYSYSIISYVNFEPVNISLKF